LTSLKGEPFAREYIKTIQRGDIDTAIKFFDEGAIPPDVDIKQLFNTFFTTFQNGGKLLSIEEIRRGEIEPGGKGVKGDTHTINGEFYELLGKFENVAFKITVVIQYVGGQTTVAGFHINTLPKNYEKVINFTLEGKSLLHYLILALAVFISIFILLTVVVCVRSNIKKKWKWIVFILFGFGKVSIVWVDESVMPTQINYQLLAILLFGAMVAKPAFLTAWTLSIAFPLGAIIFWVKKQSLVVPETEKITAEVKQEPLPEIEQETKVHKSVFLRKGQELLKDIPTKSLVLMIQNGELVETDQISPDRQVWISLGKHKQLKQYFK